MAKRKRIWEIFPKLAEAVRQEHVKVGLYGHHDWLHAFRVGDMAYRIGLDEYNKDIALMAGAAGLCHNADRKLQKELGLGRADAPEEKIRELVLAWLKSENYFLTDTKATSAVLEAVLKHDGRNNDNDSPVLVCLMDADRNANCRLDVIMRSAQYYHELPVLDPIHWEKDPAANYQRPKSVIRDLSMALEWAEEDSPFCVRTRLAKKLINDPEVGAPFLKRYLKLLKVSLKKEGLYPWPFEFSPMPPEKIYVD